MQQREAVAELLRVQMRSNPENDIALMATSGRQNRPEMLLPLSREQVTFQRKLYAAESQGTADPITSLRIAQLALKHRKNRRANQRVVLFLGSPLNEEKENSQSKGKGKEKEKTNTTTSARELKRLGLALRKANISLDLVVFGEPAEVAKSVQTLQPLVTALGPTMCQLISVHSPQQVISQQLLQQLNWLTETVQRAGPAVLGEDGESGDAELMLAIQMSLQEGAAKKVEKEVEKREGGKGSQSTEKSAISKSNGGKFGKMPRLEEKSSAKTTGVGEPGKRASLRAKEGGKNRSKNRSGVSSSSSSSSAKTNASSAADDDEDHDLGDQLLLAVMALEEGGGGQKKQQQSAEAALANQSNAASRIPMAIKTGFSLTNTPSSSNRTLSSTSKNRIPRLVLYKHKVAARKSKNTAKAAKAAKAGADHNAPRFLEVRNSSQSSTSKGRSSSSVNSSNILDRLNARESDGKSSKTSANGSSSNSKQKNSFIGYYKSNGGGSCTALKGEEKGKSSALLGNTAAAAVAGPEKQKSTSDKKSNHSAEKAAAAEAGQSKKAEALLVNTKKIQAMINAKVHSLLAAAASKVAGPLEPLPPPPPAKAVAGPVLQTGKEGPPGGPQVNQPTENQAQPTDQVKSDGAGKAGEPGEPAK